MASSDVENAMRAAAQAWATAHDLAFVWDNGAPKGITQNTLVWLFRPDSDRRLTGSTVRQPGLVEASILVPAGTGVVEAFTLAESLVAEFRGGVFAGAEVLDEVAVAAASRDGAHYRVEVRIPWQLDERRIPQGTVGAHQTPGFVASYQAFRLRYEEKVRAPLGLRTFFDNSPEADGVPPPWAIATFRTLQPVPVEMQTLLVPGRVIVALNFPLGSGVTAANTAITTIVRAFDECSFRGVTFGTPVVTRVGRTPLDTWQANVRLPFHYEVRT